MKIGFLGVGSAFTTSEYYHSNVLITSESGKALLIDCGSDARFSLPEFLEKNAGKNELHLDAVYITHLHADHIGGLEWLAISSYFNGCDHKLKLFAEKHLMKQLWQHSLCGGLSCIHNKAMELADYFELFPLARGGSFSWEGIAFDLIPMPHISAPHRKIESFGLVVRKPNAADGHIFFTGDTQFCPEFIVAMGKSTSTIFHDCETTLFKTTVHAHYEDLLTLPDAIRNKMWLYGYQPNPSYTPVADGFLGFAKKGQEFDI